MYKKKQKWPYPLLIIMLCALLGLIVVLSVSIGRYHIMPLQVINILLAQLIPIHQTWTDQCESIIFTLRLPRIMAAILVGGALALSGTSYQGIFQNPLVSPDILGVSAGACIGASCAILGGGGNGLIQICAFLGGFLAVMLTTTIPKILKNNSMMMLVLSGIIVGGMMNSIMGLIKYVADPETQLASIVYWQLGSLAQVTSKEIYVVTPIILVAASILYLLRWRINILSLGEREAKTLGMDTTFLRGVLIICSTLLTASAVCISGTIGWIGLVLPHLGRMIVGPDNVKLIPVAAILGAIFMVAIDTIARVSSSSEIPLGILTGLIGAPFYFYLLLKQRKDLR
ncbi:iron ABC transporter permease [Aminipila butyrica]|uniref:Iron ABC transporter permease n=1 Tax=Aminipila butyrica TaxID=433296 RepID=A0A858BZH5_9FIRM|nr:iron ABC transporter permease [Aminipila butyrica]QIB70330.1 iron ABC transporter permease [Aminipila butyrica]